jgi:hypothetical protein
VRSRIADPVQTTLGLGTQAWRNRVGLRFHGLVDPKARLVNFVEITAF